MQLARLWHFSGIWANDEEVEDDNKEEEEEEDDDVVVVVDDDDGGGVLAVFWWILYVNAKNTTHNYCLRNFKLSDLQSRQNRLHATLPPSQGQSDSFLLSCSADLTAGNHHPWASCKVHKGINTPRSKSIKQLKSRE